MINRKRRGVVGVRLAAFAALKAGGFFFWFFFQGDLQTFPAVSVATNTISHVKSISIRDHGDQNGILSQTVMFS